MTMKQVLSALLTTALTFAVSVKTSLAQSGVTNPALTTQRTPASVQAAQSGGMFGYYFVFFWNTLIVVGGLATLLYFLWGAIEWVTSGGDKGKLETARNRMINAFLGMIILGSSYILIAFVGFLLQIDLLQPQFFTPGP